ncbi:MAG: hypothetical protein ACXWID_05495 [Pyrinomonadaceae bacterium]
MSFNLNEVDEFRIELSEVGQKYLRQTGPMIPAAWEATPQRQEQLRLLRKTIPQPTHGYLLLDTGAAHVSIDTDVARELNIMPMVRKKTEVHGFGGSSDIHHYLANLILPVVPMRNGVAISGTFGFRSPVEAWAGKDLRANHRKWGYLTPDGKPLEVIGIIGRIVLQFTRFTYNGLTGEVEIYIDKKIMSPQRD